MRSMTAPIETAAASLDRRLARATPIEVVSEAVRVVPRGSLAVVSSFGTESAVLLALVADVDPSLPVLFLDTGWLFEETIAYRDKLAARLGLTDLRIISPSPRALAERDPERDLLFADPDACCRLRKVEPLERALQPFSGWINGRKRFHGQERSYLPMVEQDGRRLKFNPLAHTSKQEIDRLFAQHDLPRHPLEALGFASVGCIPCTSRTASGEDPRAGRWRGRAKTECGIHAPFRSPGENVRDGAMDRHRPQGRGAASTT